MINVKCVNCKNCINFYEGYYWCQIGEDVELIEECIANDEYLGCELYDEDRNDNTTKRS